MGVLRAADLLARRLHWQPAFHYVEVSAAVVFRAGQIRGVEKRDRAAVTCCVLMFKKLRKFISTLVSRFGVLHEFGLVNTQYVLNDARRHGLKFFRKFGNTQYCAGCVEAQISS